MISIRKIGVIGKTYRHFNRYRQILAVFFKYGFGDLVELLRIDQYIEIGLKMISRNRRERIEKLSRAERVRMALEELGPTYIKLGQILSTRTDLVPVDFIHELSRLQDEVPSFPFAEAKEIVENQLGRPLLEVFEAFDEIPIASASLGQVHKAKLKDGDDVAVKVQRPEIKKTIEVDLEIMLHLATLMERHIEEMALQRPVKIVEEFARALEKELDYAIEASSMERVASQFLNDTTVYIPKVYRELTTCCVLTAEYIDGIKISDIEKLVEEGSDISVITKRGADFLLKQVFENGFFHADLHPGNMFVLKENIICFIDFGMTGSVDHQTRDDFVDLMDNIIHQNESKTTEIILKLTYWDEEPDIRNLEEDVADFMAKHFYKPLKDIKISKLVQELLELASRHYLRIPSSIYLMMRALGIVEGVALMLDPNFDMIGHTEPFIRRIKIGRYSPQRIAGDIMRMSSELMQFMQQFPKDTLEIMRLIRQRKITLKFEHQGLENMLATHDQISNRISFSIIIAALLIGSALIVIAETPPMIYGISMIGIIGFLAAAIMGIWLLIAILKKGRL